MVDYRGTRAGQRHPKLDELGGRLERILFASEAELAAASAARAGGRMCLAVVGMWSWHVPGASMGRKGMAADFGQLLVPVRVSTPAGNVFVVPAEGADVPVSAVGVGIDRTQEVHLVPDHETVVDSTGWARCSAPVDAEEIPGLLAPMLADGLGARWELMPDIERQLLAAVRRAHSATRFEIGGGSADGCPPLLDDTKLEAVVDLLLLGDGVGQGKVARLLECCLRPRVFAKVDPLKYIDEALRRDAEMAIRSAIGDPHVIGRKVRRLARENGLGINDVDKLVDLYNSAWPSDRIGRKTASAAMAVGSDAMASWSDITADAREGSG